MRAVAALGERRRDAVERGVVGEGAQQLEMAFARLVHAGEDRVDDAQRRVVLDAPVRDAVAGAHALVIGGGLERADDRRADRDDALAVPALASAIAAAVAAGMR